MNTSHGVSFEVSGSMAGGFSQLYPSDWTHSEMPPPLFTITPGVN